MGVGVCSDECEFLGIVDGGVLTLVFAVSVQDVFEWHGEGLRHDLCLCPNNAASVICDMFKEY